MPLLDDLIKNAQANSSAFQKLSTTVAERKPGLASASSPNKASGVQGAYDFGGSSLPQTAQQKLLSSPIKMQDWSLTDKATSSDVYARIYQISQTDRARADQLLSEFRTLQATPSSRWYNPYSQATNTAIAEIAALGADVSGGINEKFFNDYAWLKDHYRYGTGNSPLSPAKKATKEENAAYWYYKLLDAEETTQKAENEWAALQEEVSYWANRKDRNYSFDEVLDKVNWSNYKTLEKLDADRSEGRATMLNRSIGYSRDNLRGVYWAAQNGSTGNMDADSAMSILGRGKGWTQNDTIRNKLNPASADYSPYSVGSTLDDAALYFGVSSFGKDWREKNRASIDWNDETAEKMYGKVYAAEENTLQAEEELRQLRERADELLKHSSDPDKVINSLKGLYEDCTMLKRMDESMKKGGNAELIDTTRAIDYRWADFEREVRERCDKMNTAVQGNEFAESVDQMLYPDADSNGPSAVSKPGKSIYHDPKSVYKAESLEALDAAYDNSVNAAGIYILDQGTPAEKVVFQSAYNASFENNVAQINDALKNGNVDPQTAHSLLMQSANGIALEGFPDAYKTVSQYEALEKEKQEAQAAIDRILGGNTTMAQKDKSGIGQYGKGNIDLYNREKYVNDDGSISTVDSFSVNIDGKEVLLPSIIDGKRYTDEEAIQHYMQTGENLGVFDTPEEADEYAQLLHEQQQELYTQSSVTPNRISGNVPPNLVGVSANAGGSEQGLQASIRWESLAERNAFDDWLDEEYDILPQNLTKAQEYQYYREWKAATEEPEAPVSARDEYISSLDEETRKELYAAQAKVEAANAKMAEMQGQYDEAQKSMAEIYDTYDIAEQVRKMTGTETIEASMMPDLELICRVGNTDVHIEHSSYTVYDAMRDEGKTQKEIIAAAEKTKEELQRERDSLQAALDHVGEMMFVDSNFKRNVDRTLTVLDQEIKAADYMLLQNEKGFENTATQQGNQIKDFFENRSFLGNLFNDFGEYSQLDRAVVDQNWADAQAYNGVSMFKTNFMTDEEKNTYLYLRATEGQVAAKEYYDYLANDTYGVLTVREYQQGVETAQAFTEQYPMLANAVSILSSPGRAVGGLYGMWQLITGQEVNPYSQYYSMNAFGNTVKSTTKQKITQEFGEGTALDKIANFAYDVATSAAESGVSAFMFGGFDLGSEGAKTVLSKFGLKATEALVASAPMAAGAMGDTIQEVINNGGSPEQAMLMGGVSFLAESLSEAISIDNIWDAFDKGTEGTKNLIKTVLKSFMMEGSEEVFSELVNNWADDKVMGELSKRQQYIDSYIEQGYSREEAEELAASEMIKNVLVAGLSGAFSGGLSTGTSYVLGAAGRKINNRLNDTSNIADIETSVADQGVETLNSVRDQLYPNRNGRAVNEQAAADAVADAVTVQPGAETAPEAAATPRENRIGQAINDEAAEAAVADTPVAAAPGGQAETPAAAPHENRIGQAVNDEAAANAIKNDVTVLSQAMQADEASQTASLAAVLTPESATPQAENFASAAAQYLASAFDGKKLLRTMQKMLLTAGNNLRSELAAVKNSVATAGLYTEGRAHAMLQDMVENGVTLDGIKNLIQVANEEAGNPIVVAQMNRTMLDNLIAQREKYLIGQGTMDGIRSYENSVDQAQRNVNTTSSQFNEARRRLEAMGNNLRSLIAQHVQDPANQRLTGQVTQSIKDVQGQQKVVQEFEQSLNNARDALQTARDTLNAQVEKVLSQVRQQAVEEVSQEQEQAAAEQAIQAEAQEQQRQQGNADTLSADNFIEELYPDATEEEKEIIRDRIRQQQEEAQDPEKIEKREQFTKNLSKKFGVNIEVVDTTEGGTQQRYNGSYDEKTNTITIDKAASQSDLIYAVALHELTHMAERSGMYDQLATALTRMAYTTENGTYNETQLANDIRARREMYNARLALMQETNPDIDATPLTEADAAKEIVADLTRRVLYGDEAAINSLVATDESVARRFLNSIRNFLRRLAGIDDPSVVQLRKTQQLFEQALKDARDNIANKAALESDLQSSNGEETSYGDRKQFSLRVTDQDELAFLDNQEPITTYKTMQLIDGHLYPPMAAVVAGSKEDYSVLGQWEKATEHPELIKDGNKFTLNKGKGQGSLAAAYNPYMHSSNLMINDQFSGAYARPNLVTVECEVPSSEATSNYHAEYAKDTTGWHSWHTGVVASALRHAKGTERQVFLSRWIKPVRIVPDAEVAQHYADLLSGTDVVIPDNVVYPSLLEELKKLDVPIKESGRVQYSLPEDNHMLDPGEYRRMNEALSQKGNLGKSIPKRKNGGYIVDMGDALVYTNNKGEPEHVIRNTIGTDELFDKNDVTTFAAKMEKEGVDFEIQRGVLEGLFGEGRLSFDVSGTLPAVQGQTGRGAEGDQGPFGAGDQIDMPAPEREGTPDVTDGNGEVITREMPGGTVTKEYSLASWTPEERSTVRQNLLNKGFAETDVDKWIDNVDGVASIVAADKARLDYTADPDQVMLKPNNDYVVTLDASTLCAKRLLYQGTFNEIQHLLPSTPLTPTDLIDLVNMMKDAGYETPCGICYVESRRRHLGEYAEEFIGKYEGDYKPTVADLTSTDGLSKLKAEHPEAYKAFITAMNKKGTANPKVVQLRTDYRGDIRNLTEGDKVKVVSIGGLRVQSFSDFETPHLIDMMQAVLDMSAEGLTSQAYTKVPNFAWAFGDTGIKINLSLIGDGNGLDANGNLQFSSTEGMDFNEAMRLRDRYSENVGTILVGMNNDHILAAMADDRIDFIIPFHKSGWSKVELQNVRGMSDYEDYTSEQNERKIASSKEETHYSKTREAAEKWLKKKSWASRSEITDRTDGKPGYVVKAMGYETIPAKEAKLTNFEPVGPNGYWDFSKSGKENAEAYLKLCAEQGRIPKFSRFLVDNGDGSFSLQPDGSTDGYWKTLIDFKMYDNEGNGAPQQAVTPNVNMEEAVRILNDYEGGADSLPVAQDIVDEYVAKYKAEHPREQYSLPSMDILDEQIRQYLSGGYDAYGRSLPATTNQLSTNTQQEGGQRQRQFGSQTAQRSSALHEEVKEYLRQNSGYIPDTNRAQIDRAIEWARSNATENDPDGYRATVDQVLSDDFNYASADGQARMLTALSMAAIQGDTATEQAIADRYNRQGTDIGRALQSRNIFNLMTPLGRISTLRGEVDRINQQYIADGRSTRVALSPETLDLAANAKSEREFRDVRRRAMKELAAQMPPTWKGKLQEWRMMSMLANPRTHIRNILGNAIFMPAVKFKNVIGAAIEKTYLKDGQMRTKSVTTSRENRQYARADADNIQDILTGEKKYNPESEVEAERKQFGTGKGLISKTIGKALQGISDLNSRALEAEDWIFLRKHYTNALAGWMQANNLTPEAMNGNYELLSQGRQYAIQEAQKATYRDASEIASLMNRISRNGGIAGFVVDAALPFKKTPANILKRGVEYSPVGLVQTLMSAKKRMAQYEAYQSGQLDTLPKRAMSPQQFVDGIASGLSGTAIMAIGAMLSSMGVVTVGLDDDDDQFRKLAGQQEYALNISLFGHDVSFTIDWAAPVCMPFFVGASIYDALTDEREGFDVGAVADAILQITEPVFNLSMLDGVNSLLQVNSYGDGNPMTQIFEKVLTNYLSSNVPTVVGQVIRTTDPVRRKNYVESGASLYTFRYALEQVQNKTPYSVANIPYRDPWGNEDRSDTWLAAIENFLSPGYISEIKPDELDQELERLYRVTGNSALIPKLPPKKIGQEKLTDQEYDQYTVARGTTARTVMSDLVQSGTWDMIDDYAKASLLGDALTYANQVAQAEVKPGTKQDKWVATAQEKNNPAEAIIGRYEDKQKEAYVTGYNDALKDAIDSSDLDTALTSIEALQQTGKEKSDIRRTVTDEYKPKYKAAMEKGDLDEVFEIETMLMSLGLGYKQSDFNKWLK